MCVCMPNSHYKNPPLSCCMRGDSAIADPETKAPFWYPHGSRGMQRLDGGQNQGFPHISFPLASNSGPYRKRRGPSHSPCAHTHISLMLKPRLERRLTWTCE